MPVAWRRCRILQGVVVAAALGGCGQQVPEQVVPVQGVLCSNDFQACVMPVLSGQIRRSDGATVSCMNSTCHLEGGNGGRFTLSATDFNADMQVVTTLSDLQDLRASPVLKKPSLEVTHGGGQVFTGQSDSCYVTVFDWIRNQITSGLGDADPLCGKCTPVANTSTSCGFP